MLNNLFLTALFMLCLCFVLNPEAKCAVCKATADAAKSFVNSEGMIELESEQIKKICQNVPVFKKVCRSALEKFLKFIMKRFGNFSSESFCTKLKLCP
ncbi:hypothetical protein D915_006681 [Fasciola hepatica]|uniref:Saposin B-type domain-containing protein n=1 Tax=Fasciola hepatica TaxID=6192 RepID=A0A4E0RYY2_FASHE|nr:hypothetical protein D915_006681 [Fasciola hepatica]